MENIKEIINDKKNLRNIIIYSLLFIALIIILSFIINWRRTTDKEDTVKHLSSYYQGLLNQCQLTKNPSCCADSVEYMAKLNYQSASDLGCSFGQKINTLNCAGSFKWCEMIR